MAVFIWKLESTKHYFNYGIIIFRHYVTELTSFDFDCFKAAALIWINTVFVNNMYQYNCIFFWASREEKQLFWTLVRLNFLKVLRFSFPLYRKKKQKKFPARASRSRKIFSSLDVRASLPWDECNWSTGLWVILYLNEILCLNGSHSSNNSWRELINMF